MVSGMAREVRAETLIADMERLREVSCVGCGGPLCGHRLLFSIVLGFKSEARCPACLAGALGRDLAGLSRHVTSYIRHQECYNAAWEWTSERERECDMTQGPKNGDNGAPAGSAGPDSKADASVLADAVWDAGDMGCGDLVLELRLRLRAMKPGEVLRVTARDPGAPEDLPAWCGLTGHAMVSANHPVYLIRRKED